MEAQKMAEAVIAARQQSMLREIERLEALLLDKKLERNPMFFAAPLFSFVRTVH